MVMLRVDTGGLEQALAAIGLGKKDSAQIARGLGAAAFATWKQLALKELHTTSRDYVQGLSFSQSGKVFTITLEGVVPNLVEQGFAGGDMRAWMLKSPKAKKNAQGGRYLVVPFRHGVPGTGGRNVGAPMPKELYAVAKQLLGTVTPTAALLRGYAKGAQVQGPLRSKTVWGGRLDHFAVKMAPGLKTAQRRAAHVKLDEKKREWHTTSIWTGMVRNEARYEKATQSTYGTFRTISDFKRDPRSWEHPGIQARNLASKVQAQMSSVIATVMARAIQKGPK